MSALGSVEGGPARGHDGRDRERDALDAYSRVVSGVAERLLPSVASLTVKRRVRGGVRTAGSGSAVVFTPDGLLVTSAHVVENADGGTTAAFADGREFDAEVVGADRWSDLAVVRVAADDLPAVELGDADRLRVGQLVIAVGSPLGFSGSVSAGVVSAVGRSLTTGDQRVARLIENVIQTDASLHPGNSGGALADSAGRVVGINTALVGAYVGQGLGMAVPINDVTQALIGQLIHHGRVRRAYLGIAGGSRPLPPRAAASTGHERGVEVLTVTGGGPAERAGIRPEDIIVSVDGAPVEKVGALQELLTGDRIGRTVEVVLVRGGEARSLSVRPIELDG